MAKRKSQPNGIIDTNIVWDAAGDTYSHVDIKTWLDKFDVAIGALMADRVPLGSVMPWSFPDKVTPDGTTPSIPAGWVVAKGQTLTSSQHDFPDFAGVSVVLPDYRGKVLIGADDSKTLRAAGTETVNPGVKGVQGANTSTLPDHFHNHVHSHKAGKVAGVETYHAVAADGSGAGLNDSPANSPPYINTDASGTGHNVTLQGHAHQLASFYTSVARDPAEGQVRVVDAHAIDGSSANRPMTSLQIRGASPRASGQSSNANTTDTAVDTPDAYSGSTGPGDSLTASAYQKSEAVYFIMKVKWGTDYTRPWVIRNSAGSVASVGVA